MYVNPLVGDHSCILAALAELNKEYKYCMHHCWNWLKTLPETRTIVTCYFPETVSGYDPYLFMFETDYEDFIIDLFSELPTTSWFFNVSDRLFVQVWVERGSMKSVFRVSDVSKLRFRHLMRDLLKKGIVKSKARASIECYWRED